MGRYTSVQAFSDQNTKMVSGYKRDGAGDSAKAPLRAQPEKVENVMGSCAGAGSGEFDMYRAARRRELNRLDALENQQRKDVEAEIFSAKVARNKREADERTAKNSEARRKKKQKKMLRGESVHSVKVRSLQEEEGVPLPVKHTDDAPSLVDHRGDA